MADSIELERTYLPKYLPKGMENCESSEMIDIYIPESAKHPTLRIRKKGSKFEITKKQPVREGDASKQTEQTIPLTEPEFMDFFKLKGKRVSKQRYLYTYNGRTAEIDVFKGALEGLALVDFEFDKQEELDSFKMPDFCLADVTQEDFIAGGMLCGKSYSDIESNLSKFGYTKIPQPKQA